MGVRLIIEDLEGATTVVPLASEEVTIGRKEHNTIQLTEQNVSRTHAKLTYRDDGWLIEDLRSYNGVRVNGIPITGPTVLREGDLIQIADYSLTLTDDVDRQTVEIERPRAANDDVVAMAGSSAALPSVSAHELPPGRGAVSAARADDDRESKGGGGVWVVVVGLAVLLGGAGVFVFMQDDRPGPTKAEQAPAKQTEKPAPVEPLPPEPIPDPIPEPPTTAVVAPGDTDTGEPELEETGGDVEPPEPTEPDPVDPKPDKKPNQTKPKVDPVAALADARKELMSGNSAQAYKLAKSAYDAGKDSEALDVMGVAACKMGSESKAKAAYKKMGATQKGKLEKVCGPLGIQLG